MTPEEKQELFEIEIDANDIAHHTSYNGCIEIKQAIDFINQLLKTRSKENEEKIDSLFQTRQEKMVNGLEKEKELHLETYEENILEKGIIIGIDKAIEIINK